MDLENTKNKNLIKNISRYLNKFGLLILVLLAVFLNIYKLWDLGYGNDYYAAAIKSMQTSFSNFFFLSFDSTGFISIDKPPLSLWVDAIFAKIFGFHGFVILLPHAIEGVLVTILTYKIVEKFGSKTAAFVAALIMTVSPVNVAVYRNNTPDALLLVFVLLTILFIQKYFESKKLKFVILSAVMLGLGFNTKMLQAYLILPAMLVALVIFSPGKIISRIKPLTLFLIVTAIVSFSWITIVDLTPASKRPYVGGSENNSAWNLAFGYNGTQRFEGESSVGGNAGFNVGEKGLTRLFTGEMGTQTGWFLGSAIVFSVVYFATNYKNLIKKFLGKSEDTSTWSAISFISIVFLATQYVFFSYAAFFHSYYLNIFAIPIALLGGSLVYKVIKSKFKNKVLILTLALSIPVQIYLINYAKYATYVIPILLVVGPITLVLLFFKNYRILYPSFITLVIVLTIAPLIWSGYTTVSLNTATAIFIGGPSVSSGNNNRFLANTNKNQSQITDGGRPSVDGNNRPNTRPSNGDGNFGSPGGAPPQNINTNNTQQGGSFQSSEINSSLLNYLKENYNGEKYFVAVPSSSTAEGFILEADIGNVMTLGGFSGRDQAISLEDLKQKIADGEIRFFYLGSQGNTTTQEKTNSDGTNNFANILQTNINRLGNGGMFNANQDITNYVTSTCTSVSGINGLYDCKI